MVIDNTSEPEFIALQEQSARIGADPWQVQGAGGNTSIKQNDVLWIKASGQWLRNAQSQDMFVPVQRSSLLAAVHTDDPRAEKSTDFIVSELNPLNLRPSIETTLHAILEQRVVIHVHCVDTISVAIREDAEELLASKLAGFNWVFIPYVRPGLPLTRSISARLQEDTDVLVLGNHGLVVAAHSVEACVELLQRVRLALYIEPRSVNIVHDGAGKETLQNKVPALTSQLSGNVDFTSAPIEQTHAIAFDDDALNIAAGGSLYPDHVIFLGKGSAIAQPDESADELVQRYADNGETAPVSIIFPGFGVAIRNDATAGQHALARCLSDVCLRVPENSAIKYLNDKQNYELLNWEAEQYRQTLSKQTDV